MESPAMKCTTEVECGAVVPKYGYTYLIYLLPLGTETESVNVEVKQIVLMLK